MTAEEALKNFEKSVEQYKCRLAVEMNRGDMEEVRTMQFYIARDEIAIKALNALIAKES